MLLEKIHSPNDLKQLPIKDLEKLAQEIRTFLIEQLSKTGGHLGPNLGVVELTLVLHYLFDSPKDKFVWDVGHQAYVHKILTGRQHLFPSLRQYKGLCGFPKMAESEHDVWETGHSSTSLSAAMGMAIARDLQGKQNHVVAIIGDGSMTGGMAFEALNHIGHEQKRVIVILNDNEMSIDPNVGALHNYLGKLRTNKTYKKAKEDVEHLLNKIPAIGGALAKTAEKLKDTLKYMIVSGVLFEELGYTYLGPVDGHNMEELMTCMKQAAKIDGPVLMHVITKKGKGYIPAENLSTPFHGVSYPYKIESGEMIKKPAPVGYNTVFADTLLMIAKEDKRVVVITPAMLYGSGLLKFQAELPNQCFDVGIAEQHATTMSGGLATQGMKPVLAIYSTFLQRGYDQLVHDICRQNLNVLIAIDRAGFVGGDGETHQGVYDIAYMRSIPNITIMMPKDENELRHMIWTGIKYNNGPIAVRYPRGSGLGVPMDDQLKELPIGKSEVIRDGKHVAIVAFGTTVALALRAADMLELEGINAKVINARFAKPLDEEMLLELALEGYQVITVEEGSLKGGFGSAVLEFYNEQGKDNVVSKIFGVPDYFVEHGSDEEQRAEIGLTPEAIAEQVKLAMPRQQHKV